MLTNKTMHALQNPLSIGFNEFKYLTNCKFGVFFWLI